MNSRFLWNPECLVINCPSHFSTDSEFCPAPFTQPTSVYVFLIFRVVNKTLYERCYKELKEGLENMENRTDVGISNNTNQ